MEPTGKHTREGGLFPGCTAVKLISQTGWPYWLRTCDIGGDIWKEGAHVVSFPKGYELALHARPEPLRAEHAILGVTHNALDTWLLDGVNDAGLTGGLLALYEATSVPQAQEGMEGVMGMEIVTYLLSRCATARQVAEAARRIQILDVPLGEGKTVPSTMHGMFVDAGGGCVILEAADPQRPGMLTVYEDNLGLMTNSPPYPRQLENLSWFLSQSPEWGWGREEAPALTLNGLDVAPDAGASHFSNGGGLPASYAACDRFVRMALLKYLNHEGRDFADEEMLPLGSQLMCAVVEPHNQGMFHSTRFDEKEGPQGGHESYTQYLVMYDPAALCLYLKPYGATAWTKVALDECSRDDRQGHRVCRGPMAGVVDSARL